MDNNIDILRFNNRDEWRKWLEANFDKKKAIWFVFPLKNSEEKAISYNDAVEEALCFGWIDSITKKLDENHRIQKFSVRKPNSSYSQPNKERLRWLLARNLIHPTFSHSINQLLNEEFIYPEDILKAIQEDKTTWDHFQKFSASYKRIRIAYIEAARNQPDEFKRRLANFITKTKKGKIIPGYGGIDKYY